MIVSALTLPHVHVCLFCQFICMAARTIAPLLDSGDDRPCRMRLLMILLFARLSTLSTHAPLGLYVAYFVYCTLYYHTEYYKHIASAREYMYIECVLASWYDLVRIASTQSRCCIRRSHTHTDSNSYTHFTSSLSCSLLFFLSLSFSHSLTHTYLYAQLLDEFASFTDTTFASRLSA